MIKGYFRDENELEAEMRRKMEQQLAIEQQLVEKRRLEKLKEQREKIEIERFERERRVLEARQQREDDFELNKWKQQMVKSFFFIIFFFFFSSFGSDFRFVFLFLLFFKNEVFN